MRRHTRLAPERMHRIDLVEADRAMALDAARYRTLVDALTEFVVVTNPYGRVVGPQASWSAYTGQSVAACAALGWRDALHPLDRAVIDAQWDDRVVRRKPFSFAARIFNAASGDYRQCECRAAPVRDEGNRVIEWIVAATDVHERYLAQERERETAERFRRIFDANVFGVCYGEGKVIRDANAAMLDMLGATTADLGAGIPVAELTTHEGFAAETREYEVRRLDGRVGYLVAAGVTLRPERGWLAFAVDVTQRRLAEREIEHRAMHDDLTGLPNRRLLVDRLEHAIARLSRQDTLVGVLFCDLDHFKEINDAHGHAAGDLVLETVARRLQTLVRDSDTVARTGGDEFVVILEDLLAPDAAARIAERVRITLSEPIVVDGTELHVTSSIGVAISTNTEDRVEELLHRADDAMYLAKQHGRNGVEVGIGDLESHFQPRWIERELTRALAEGTLELAFQPVIDLREARPIGAEALLRWRIDGNTMPTDRVIAIAEETGIITSISDWVIHAACAQFRAWRSEHGGAPDWKVHVNVSARDLADEHFVERVLLGIERGGLDPSDVCLEVTETAMVRNPERARDRLARLREHGITVAIDDFGMGYASLGVLRDVPADVVKIDRSFIAALHHSERDRAIVQHAIELAHQLDILVVGEGVETLAQMVILDELGCDQAQGYAFACPAPVAELDLRF